MSISTNGQMTLNAFKAWLLTDEATHFLEDLLGRMYSYELERCLRDVDSLKRRERIARKCIACAKNDEYLRGRYIFRGDAGDAGAPSDCNCLRVEEPLFRVVLNGTEFGRLVDNLPEIDVYLCEDAGLGQDLVEDRRIVRELFRSFVAKLQQLRLENCRCYSSVMLRLESLPCAYHKVKKHESWFVISYSPSDDQQSNYLPLAYKTVKIARGSVKRLAERVVPRDWDRYKIVIDDSAATITKLERPFQGRTVQHQMEIRLQVEHEPILVPKDRLIPIDNPPVEDWMVARAKDWELRNLTMEQWLERMDARRAGSAAAADAAEKCDWWKIDLERLGQGQWVRVLRYRPELFEQCPFVNDFYDEQWCALLRRQPQFADRFERLDQIEPGLWIFLLRRQPQFADRFHAWDGLDADGWIRLLKDQPQFSDRCPWNMLSGYDWKELLIVRPEFESHCEWGKLSGRDWQELLIARPEYAGNCDKWETIGADEWCELLQTRPEFQNKCDWENFHWDEVSEERWVQLVGRQPWILERAGQDATVWGKMSAANWVKILGSHPELSSTCEQQFSKWEGLTMETFVRLITFSPGLAERCDWPLQWNADEQAKILVSRPEVEPHVCFTAFSSKNWVAVLEKIPSLADKCDWNGFTEQELVTIVERQKNLIDFVPGGRIVSRRAWIDLSKQNDVCRRRFLQELNIDALDGRAITDILLELPELAEHFPSERIESEIDKKRLLLLQRELAEKNFGGGLIPDCWSNSYKWQGRDGIVLGVRVQGDLFSLPDTIGPCDAIVVMTIRGRSKQITKGYRNWKKQNAESHKKVELEVVPPSCVGDDQWGYPLSGHGYSIYDHDVSESLNRAFTNLSQLGVRSVAINGIKPEVRSFTKLIEDWFRQNSSSISVVYLVDKEDARAFWS